MQHRLDQRGFTLIEIMVVMFILALLTALVVPNIMGQSESAKVKAAQVQLKSLRDAVRLFQVDNGRLPTMAEGLAVLIPPPPTDLSNYNPDGYVDEVPTDPWKVPYEYRTDGRRFTIVSYGRDGEPGGEGFAADLSS